MSVGEILEKYSWSKMFDSYGFGGKLPSGQVASMYAYVYACIVCGCVCACFVSIEYACTY
jgi:hypothetical protein